ncbi:MULTISPECIES: hypothetical protein [Hydrogenophaga]|uniref:Uncharacterized protein n=2 Tax=Hydrogenophaga TaxID=47420 RepID=A0ABW2QD41_9BURK
MTIKAIFRRLTGRGGALNRAKTTREICQLNVLAAGARVSVYELD